MESISIINSFSKIGKVQKDLSSYFSRMKDLVMAYNFADHPVKLYIMGDERSGVRFRIECTDPPTRTRIENVLRQYLFEHRI
jgi:hypothetical protein